jgi:hypothetical protein
MKQFQSVVKDVNKTLNELILFDLIVNTTLVFLGFFFIFAILDFNGLYSLIPSSIYFGYVGYKKLAFSKALMVEDKYAPLREKLRTAEDNMEGSGPVIEELQYEVCAEMKNVGSSMFVNPKRLSYKVFFAMALSFLIIFATTLDIKILDLAKQNVPDIFDSKSPKGVGDFTATELNTSEDIYGEKDVAELGDDQLNIRIKPVDFKVNVREEGDISHQEFETVFPSDLAVKESQTYDENIPIEQQELVKNYFKKLTEG